MTPNDYRRTALLRISTEDKQKLAMEWVKRCVREYLILLMVERTHPLTPSLEEDLKRFLPDAFLGRLEELTDEKDDDIRSVAKYLYRAGAATLTDAFHFGTVIRFIVCAIRRAAPIVELNEKSYADHPPGTFDWISSMTTQAAEAAEQLLQAEEIAQLLPRKEEGGFLPIQLDTDLGMPKLLVTDE